MIKLSVYGILIFFLFAFLDRFAVSIETELEYSGVYSPNIRKTGSAEDFAAAWLISKERFLASKRFLDSSTNMAGVSFAITRARCRGCYTMLTRDYFDFLVEHLSTTSNQIPSSNKFVFQIYYNRIKNVVKELKDIAYDRPETDPRLKQTVATLIYSSITFSRPQAIVQASIREPFFEATFWSVYRYIPYIIVFVGSDHDRIAVENMKLPAIEIKQLQVPLDHKNRTVALPRYSLSWLDSILRASMISINTNNNDDSIDNTNTVSQRNTLSIGEKHWEWSQFKYVYFSEGDQILHMRRVEGLYETVDRGQGKIAVVPHRMQTLPLMQSLPNQPLMNKIYKKAYHLNLPNSTTVTLNIRQMTGSCCDNGRYIVTECGHWWYQCSEWGLKDINPWLQFGINGYTTPPATAHKGTCIYTSEKIVCPKPVDCQYRIPPKVNENEEFLGTGVCEEMPINTRLGPLNPSVIVKKNKNSNRNKRDKMSLVEQLH